MAEQEHYLKYIEPYRIYFLILEFFVLPLAAVLAGYALGDYSSAFAIVIGYLAADILVMATKGRTLLGIKLAGMLPWKIPGSQIVLAVMAGLFLLVVASVAVRELSGGDLFLGLAALALIALGICHIASRWLKGYRQPLALVSMLLVLAIVLLIGLYADDMMIKLVILLLALIWAFFVALGAYSLVFRKPAVQS